MGGPFGLDMGTLMQIGVARGVDLQLLTDVLPAAEAAILHGFHDESGAGDGDEEG